MARQRYVPPAAEEATAEQPAKVEDRRAPDPLRAHVAALTRAVNKILKQQGEELLPEDL